MNNAYKNIYLNTSLFQRLVLILYSEFSNRLIEQAEDLGFRVHVFSSSPTKQNIAEIGPTIPIDQNANLCKGITFCGHMDVVPVDGQNWNTDPFQSSYHK